MKIDLKRTKKELNEEKASMSEMPQDQYPWGLSLYLDNETLDKMPEGFFEALELGQPVAIVAEGKVESRSENETTEGVNRSARIQLTAIELPDPEKASPADKIFGKNAE